MAVAHWPRRPLPSVRSASLPRVGGRCSCLLSLKASRTTSPLAPISACSRIWSALRSAELAPSSAWLSPSRAFSLLNDKATAMRVLSLSGKPSASRSGPAVSTLIRKVSGLRRYRPGRFVGEAAMTNAGSLAGMWRCIFRPCVRGRHGAPAGCFPRCGPWRRRCRPPRITRKTLEPRPGRGHRSRRRLATRGMFVG